MLADELAATRPEVLGGVGHARGDVAHLLPGQADVFGLFLDSFPGVARRFLHGGSALANLLLGLGAQFLGACADLLTHFPGLLRKAMCFAGHNKPSSHWGLVTAE